MTIFYDTKIRFFQSCIKKDFSNLKNLKSLSFFNYFFENEEDVSSFQRFVAMLFVVGKT